MHSNVNGNVGIGTSEPWSKLDVIGSFRLTEAAIFGLPDLTTVNWYMQNDGPGKGPSWFGSFSEQEYDARIHLWDYTAPKPGSPARPMKSQLLIAGSHTDVDLILDGRLACYAELIVGMPGNWQMKNEGAGTGPFWFGYFSKDNYDARISLADYTNPAPNNRSIFRIEGANSDTDLIVDGRLGLLNDLVVGHSGTALFADVSTGNVGIGTTSPTDKLDVQGTARLRGIPAGWGTEVVVDSTGRLLKAASSARYKTDIKALADDAEKILNLRPVRFRWQATGEADIGLIAEEVAGVLDSLVIRDTEGKPEAVKYDKVPLYLLSVIKAQQQRIETCEAENRSLTERIEALEQNFRHMQVPAQQAR